MTDASHSPDSLVSEAFLKFRQRLIGLARSRLAARVRQKVDPEDVVQSVFRSFFRQSDTDDVRPADDDEMWNYLVVITIRKCAGYGRHYGTQKRDLNKEVPMAPVVGGSAAEFHPPGDDPTPSHAAMLTETLESVMCDLDEREREMFTMRLQGYELEEISDAVQRSERTVRRLLNRVRERLARVFAAESDAGD